VLGSPVSLPHRHRAGAARGVALAALAGGLALAGWGSVRLWHDRAQREQIAALDAGHDVRLDDTAPPAMLVARARFLISHGNIDAARAIADRIGGTAPAARASLFYALGNAHLRHALDIFKEVPFRVVSPIIVMAKSEYRQALQLDPDNWDARYNYSLAAALVRDTAPSQPTAGDQMSHERAAWPDIPGAPNGLP